MAFDFKAFGRQLDKAVGGKSGWVKSVASINPAAGAALGLAVNSGVSLPSKKKAAPKASGFSKTTLAIIGGVVLIGGYFAYKKLK